MNRGYTVEEYMKKIDYLRKINPQISITSDVIVGFPGETIKDYQETIDMMGKIRFDSLFSFKYSERKGTAAQELKDKVVEQEKLRRLEELLILQNQHTMERNHALVGSTQELLIEGKSKNSESDLTGRTSSWKIVNFKGETDLIGRIVEVKITKAYLHSLRGKIDNNQEVYSVN
jgi:tRNA-2-methylthio-N6-dimethylallyladenosine synthase